nr:xylulose kinase-1 [Tanacetum cinerariifolium]
MEHYLGYTDYPIWEVIQKGNGPVQVSTDTHGQVRVFPPKTAKEIFVRERERKARTTLLIVIPEDHLAKFYKITDAKEMFQSLLSQLEIHGAGVSTEDANQKFLSGPQLDHDDLEQLALTRPKLSASIATIHDTLLESANQKEIKKVEGEMQEILDTKQETIRGDLQNKMNIKLCSLLIEKVLIELVMLKMTWRTMLLWLLIPATPGQTLSQISAKDKSRLRYGSQMHEGDLNYENEVLESVFDSRSSDVENNHVNDRFAKVKGIHVVPPLKFDFRIDESKFTYGPKQSKNSESCAKTSNLASCKSNSSVETLEYVPKPVESKPKAVSKHKVLSDAPIIEEYESDSDDEYVFKALVEQ